MCGIAGTTIGGMTASGTGGIWAAAAAAPATAFAAILGCTHTGIPEVIFVWIPLAKLPGAKACPPVAAKPPGDNGAADGGTSEAGADRTGGVGTLGDRALADGIGAAGTGGAGGLTPPAEAAVGTLPGEPPAARFAPVGTTVPDAAPGRPPEPYGFALARPPPS